jgi:pSer/pThr/pTyr-binding forkhead associated (FHA) protein
MTGLIMLAVRVAMVIALYAFLFWALFTIWQDFRQQKESIQFDKPPTIQIHIQEDSNLQIHTFNQVEITIGRDPTNDCVLKSDTISAHHARLTHHHGQWFIEDNKSTNGTYIHGERISSPIIITSGDQVSLGDITIVFQEVQPAS